MKEELCQAFCGELSIRTVPAGFAISTAFDNVYGDPLGFYVVGPDHSGKYRIEDDGASVAFIEATGADLKSKTRAEAFNELLSEYGIIYDEESGELITEPLIENQIPKQAIRFIAFLLRVQDMVLMAAERAASTFREDAMRVIEEKLGSQTTITENEAVNEALSDFPADVVIRAKNRDPVAVFFGLSDQKVTEAILLHMAATYEAKTPCSVVALLEKERSISQKTMQRAVNRLAATPIFRGDEGHSIDRIAREALGGGAILH